MSWSRRDTDQTDISRFVQPTVHRCCRDLFLAFGLEKEDEKKIKASELKEGIRKRTYEGWDCDGVEKALQCERNYCIDRYWRMSWALQPFSHSPRLNWAGFGFEVVFQGVEG